MTEEVIKKHLVAKGIVTIMLETDKKLKRDISYIMPSGLGGFTWLKWNTIPEYKQILVKIKKHVKTTKKVFKMDVEKPFDAYRELLLEQGYDKDKAFSEVLETKKRFYGVENMLLHTETGKDKFNAVKTYFNKEEIEQIFSEHDKNHCLGEK